MGNLYYTGPLFFGTPLQGNAKNSQFVFDTSSSFVVVKGSQCTTCTSQYYNTTASSTAEEGANRQGDRNNITYGSAVVNGSMWTDQICLSEKMCAKSVGFFVADETNGGLAGLDGVVGLAPYDDTFSDLTGPSFFQSLVSNNPDMPATITFNLNPYP